MGLIFAYAFAFQIYCDFAAYSTIARGIARLFGVNLMRNFLTPYFSKNPSEFWTRWHISLSTWSRDYLDIPLGGSKHGRLMTVRNLMITMFLGGLWHGAGFFFIVWGLYHGMLLVLYRLVPIDDILIQRYGRAGKIISIVFFFHLVCIGWIFFRATPDQLWPIVASFWALPSTIGDAVNQHADSWTEISGVHSFLIALARTVREFLVQIRTFFVFGWGLILFMTPVWITDFLGWRQDREFPDLFEGMSWPVRTSIILALVYGIIFFARREANEFIYFAF